MTRPGLARPVIIKMDRDLAEDIIHSNMRTLGVSGKEFLDLIASVRRKRRASKRKKRTD